MDHTNLIRYPRPNRLGLVRLTDPAPAETYGVKAGSTWPPQSSRYRV